MSTDESPPTERVALYLAFPAALEEDLIDFCHAQAGLFSGFTMFTAEGFGEGSRLHSAAEIVLGRARRRVLFSILEAENVDRVLAELRDALPSREIVYWTTRVERFGRLR